MAKQDPRSSNTIAERANGYSAQSDREVMQALVTAGALVALADGQVDAIERDALVDFIDRLAGRSLASIVVRTAERVAAADRQIHRGELNTLKLIRLLLMTLPNKRPNSNIPCR